MSTLKSVKEMGGDEYGISLYEGVDSSRVSLLDKMSEQFITLIDKGLNNVPKQMSLKLPKLKKTSDESPKLKLPKLKKVEV